MASSKALLLAATAALALAAGCKRRGPPVATDVWLGPAGGCIATKDHPTFGGFGCWGVNDHGQLGDGTTAPWPMAGGLRLEGGAPTDLALGERHTCAVFDGRAAYCWGDGRSGQLGADVAGSLTPVATGDASDEGLTVRVGGAHTCVRSGAPDRLRCFGADGEGQLGAPSVWDRGAPIRALSLGEAHTCAAYAPVGAAREVVVCRGRAVAAPVEPLLAGEAVVELAAGRDHTCALLEGGDVRCWGRNDLGQLGDGTKNDARAPVAVLGVRGAVALVSGANHACARLRNDTVVCWGDNARHQLANGTVAPSAYPVLVAGLSGVRALAAGGDATCAALARGAVRCWGKNDRGQLGDGSTDEHTVPMPIGYR